MSCVPVGEGPAAEVFGLVVERVGEENDALGTSEELK